MDNVTHTLVGLAIAEAAVQLRLAAAPRGGVSRSWRRATWLTSALAGNLADLDLVLTPLTGGKLGYMLHHRGYTHTLALALPLALAALVAPWLAWRRGACLWSRRDAGLIVAVALAGPLVHIALDYGNSYGVHPFWPLDDAWRYGDALFIVEPWLWLTLAAPLFFMARATGGRVALALVTVVALVLLWGSGLVPTLMAALVTGWWALVGLGARALGPKARVGLAAAATCAVVAVFAGTSVGVRAMVLEGLARDGLRAYDVALTPFPANPLCWSAIAVETSAPPEERLVLRRGVFAAWPGALPASRCSALMSPLGAAPVVPEPSSEEPPAMQWQGRVEAPLATWRALDREHCEVAAFLRFARAPYLVELPDGRLHVGDLRFERGERGRGFAEIVVDRGPTGRCPPRVPPWVPPLEPLLQPGA